MSQHLEGSENLDDFATRREARANNSTGALPSFIPAFPDYGEIEYSGNTLNFEEMIESLRELFSRDRQIASQADSTRCGICYIHYPVHELHYRDEGLYMCISCENALGKQKMPVLRKQQKL